ncbi:MAG TPA: tetratricopeptide repeat protein [Pyrinomonadaceae bacterium]
MSNSRAKSAAARAPLLLLLLLLSPSSLPAAALTARPHARPAAARQADGAQEAALASLVERARRGALDDAEFARAVAVGHALAGGGRHAEAARLFEALVAARPSDRAALYGAALATFNTGRPADAEPLARRAVEAARASGQKLAAADALVLLAVVLAVRRDDAGALKASAEAAALAPDSFDAQLTYGRALYGAGDDAGAARAFRAATALSPADARPRFFLATALERAGDAEGALAAYRELVGLQPRALEGHLGLGALLVKRGGAEAEEGIRELLRAAEIDPDNYEARVSLGRALVARGRAAEAVGHLRRAAALAPGNPEPHYQLSLAYRKLGRREEAAAESAVVKQIHESRRGAATAPTAPKP